MNTRIIVTIGHPAHVHFYKNFIREMERRGHQVVILAERKEISILLLEKLKFAHIVVSEQRHNGVWRIFDQLIHEYEIYKIARNFRPDIITGVGGTAASHVAKAIHCTSIIFTDTEHARLANSITFPFSDVICTPSCYSYNIGDKHVRYNGYKELAYLHPNEFTPDPSILDELGLTSDDRYIVVRFVSWQASHDIGQQGIRNKVELVKRLEEFGRVFITSESSLPPELQPNQILVSPERLHDLLYYATLYIGEGATTASECAVLGTHAIYVNTLGAGTISEQKEKYGLVLSFSDPRDMDEEVISTAIKLLDDPELRRKGKSKREQLLKEKIDLTAFMVWFIDNYPGSWTEVRENRDLQNRFISLPEGY